MLKSLLLSVGLLCFLCEVTGAPKSAGCPTLKLNFGRVRYRQKGRFVKFTCITGYLIAGQKYSTCHNGSWDSPLPKCVRASCNKVNPPINGLIYPSHRGAILNFFCKPGYELRGPNITYCDGRTWDNKLPACIVSNTKPALSCDFESEDLCGWNHDLSHDFDWKRMNFRTPSGHLGTGPSFDHTKGEEGNGYYMYTESSSRNENDTARLISPIYDKMNETNVCLEFFYHMHGASTGQLRVYLKKESDSWDLEPSKALFWKSGNHGDRWLRSLTEIGPINEDFQIIIEGIRGTSYFSDIAIDDVRIMSNCTIDDDATTESDVTYPDDFQAMQSCFNRCDNDNLVVQPAETFQLSCGCDETCIDNSTCCPDYFVICVLGVIEDFSTTTTTLETPRESPNPTTTPKTTTRKTTTKATTTKATTTKATTTKATTTKATTTKVTTTKTVTIRQILNATTQLDVVTPKKNKMGIVDTNEINSVLPKTKTKNNTNNVAPPPKKYNLANATNFNRAPKPYVPRLTKPVLVFLTPSTPEDIVEKVKLENTTKSLPRQRGAINITKPTTKALPVPVPTKPSVKVTSTQEIDEILTVPQNNDEDKTYFDFENITTKAEENSSPLPIRQAPNEKVVLLSNSNTQNQKIVKEKPQTNTKFIIIIVASVSVILLVVLSSVFVVRRYKFNSCKGRHGLNGASSDSQSDVRFLTSDEMLDFNLAYGE